MPSIITANQKEIKLQQKAMEELMSKCEENNLFKGKPAEEVLCYYYVLGYNYTDDGAPIVAIAKFENVYAMRAPECLTEEQLEVFKFALQDVQPQNEIVVFSQRDYDAVMKYKYNKAIKVTLCK